MTVEEIAHELAGATVYTKADALKAFLQIHLTHEASLLTMFNSHRGRLRFLRMPFGAKMSQDVFQMQMDAILEQCPGVIGIHDDMVIYGVDQEDHDANLINLLNICQKEGSVLNSKKLELRKECVTFFGAEYSALEMHPDPKKVQGITEMTAPTDKQQLQSFLGMVNYMGTFIPNLSHHTEPLRAMLKKDNVFHWEEQQTRSFQEVLADLRTTRIGTDLPSPAEILHGRNLTMKAQAEIDINAIRSLLQERQLKMMLAHDSSRRAKKARPLVVGERCYVLGPNNKWIDAFVTGTKDSGRSYDTQVEATGGNLTRNHSHIRSRGPDIPQIHDSFLQQNSVLSGIPERNASEKQNLVISGQLANPKSQKTVLSGKPTRNIKPTNTSQVLVSETVPSRRVQLSREAKKTRFQDNPVSSTWSVPPRRQPRCDTSTRNRRNFRLDVSDPDLLLPLKQTRVNETDRHSDLREPQPSSSDSHPASSQPVSETTTSESSVSLPSSPSGSSCTTSTSTSGTDSSSSETSSESSSQPSSNASSPETTTSASSSRSTSPELLQMERSFNSLLAGTREKQGHAVTRRQMGDLREQQQWITILKQVAMQPQNQPRPVSAPPAASMPLPPYPQRRPCDKGSTKQVQAENASAPRKNSSDSETGLNDIQEEPRRHIGPSRVKQLAKFFTPSSDEEDQSCVNIRTRHKRLFNSEEKEGRNEKN